MNCKSGQIYLDAGSSVVVHGQRLGSTLSLVVAASDTCLAPTTKKDPLSDLSPHLAPPAYFWSPRFNLSRPALGSQIFPSLSLSLSLSSSRAQLCSTSKTLTDPQMGLLLRTEKKLLFSLNVELSSNTRSIDSRAKTLMIANDSEFRQTKKNWTCHDPFFHLGQHEGISLPYWLNPVIQLISNKFTFTAKDSPEMAQMGNWAQTTKLV